MASPDEDTAELDAYARVDARRPELAACATLGDAAALLRRAQAAYERVRHDDDAQARAAAEWLRRCERRVGELASPAAGRGGDRKSDRWRALAAAQATGLDSRELYEPRRLARLAEERFEQALQGCRGSARLPSRELLLGLAASEARRDGPS